MVETKFDLRSFTDCRSSYFIALEAWRRKLSVTFIKNIDNYYISSQKKALFFSRSGMISGKTGIKNYNICKNKNLTKKYLLENNVNTADGFVCDISNERRATLKVDELGYPVVLKQYDGARGENVFSNIQNQVELKQVIRLLLKKNIDKVLIEKHIDGQEYRVFVVGEKAVDSYMRDAAHIIGDGLHTIKELIEIKNLTRRENPHLCEKPIITDDEVNLFLERENLNLDTILKKSKKLYLHSKANLSQGGDLVDVTNSLPDKVVSSAIKAVNSIPDLSAGGVDLIYNDKDDKAYVLEINSLANLGGNHFSDLSKNKEKTISVPIIDLFFPESIDNKNKYEDLYFDQISIQEYLQNDEEKEYSVTQIPLGEYEKKVFFFETKDPLKSRIDLIRNELRRMCMIGNLHEKDKESIFSYYFKIAGRLEDLGYIKNWIKKTFDIEQVNVKDFDGKLVNTFIYFEDKSNE